MATDPYEIKEEENGLLASNMPQQAKTTAGQTDLTAGNLTTNANGAYFTPSGSSEGLFGNGLLSGSQPQAPAPGEEDTVETRLTNLLKKDNPYLAVNRANAQRQAQSRGLQNSTMAATAGEKAAIEASLPIVTQDAGYYQQKGLQTQQSDISSRLQQEQGEIQKGLYETQGNISKDLAAQQYAHETTMKQADIEWNKLDLNARMAVEYDRMEADRKAKFDETANAIGDDYMRDYMELMLNPNFATPEDRQKAIDVLNANTKARYDVAAAIAGAELDWTPPTVTAAQNAGASGGSSGDSYIPPPPNNDPHWQWDGASWQWEF